MGPVQLANPRERVATLRDAFRSVRQFSRMLCAPLQIEDYVIQSMPDVSPTRWHLAHTTWFFETFLLKRFVTGYRSPNDQFEYLFNSYYNSVGRPFPRPQRGHLSRPTVAEVWQYRAGVDEAVLELLDRSPEEDVSVLLNTLELGLHHEQQHQELMLTDIKHVLSCNPIFPVYRPLTGEQDGTGLSLGEPYRWIRGSSGITSVGSASLEFNFDNERPRHEVLLVPHQLGSRLVTCGEYRQFMESGAYRQPQWWLSLGWQTVEREQWQAPLYWHRLDGEWMVFTLHGLRPIDDAEPVCHVSYFEADAYARWSGARLPSEAEWESAATQLPIQGNFVESGRLHPTPAVSGSTAVQFYGDVWEWTSSPYLPYPGYSPAEGALGEYNGKFMCNQYVLRGGSCATPQSHIRSTYRNFFPPEARWQFSGIRLAKDDF